MSIIISADEIKKTLPNYLPERAEEFHTESARRADKMFADTLKNSKLSQVILMNGGTASGKTEFLAAHLDKKDYIILDTTLSTIKGAKIKIGKILKAHKIPVVYSVVPDDLGRAFIAFLNRDRKFSDIHFYRTHSNSRKTLLSIADNYPNIEVKLVESAYTADQKLTFTLLKFANLKEFVSHLKDIQMTEADILNEIKLKLDQ